MKERERLEKRIAEIKARGQNTYCDYCYSRDHSNWNCPKLNSPLRRVVSEQLSKPGAKWTPETGWTDAPIEAASYSFPNAINEWSKF